ncbi:MAG: hypothetical protein FD123_978 [Bacteroidetes bacterium]|nr:MAG: hypothetical protein FD123_978 [Bacteroidota bacterium]
MERSAQPVCLDKELKKTIFSKGVLSVGILRIGQTTKSYDVTLSGSRRVCNTSVVQKYPVHTLRLPLRVTFFIWNLVFEFGFLSEGLLWRKLVLSFYHCARIPALVCPCPCSTRRQSASAKMIMFLKRFRILSLEMTTDSVYSNRPFFR